MQVEKKARANNLGIIYWNNTWAKCNITALFKSRLFKKGSFSLNREGTGPTNNTNMTFENLYHFLFD